MFREEQEICQMFGGYLHQDWMYEYVWDEGEKPHFSAAIEAYKEDCEEVPEVIDTTIDELNKLIARNYSEEFLRDKVWSQLGIAINPRGYGLTRQEFLQEVLKILTDKKLEKTEESNPQTTETELFQLFAGRFGQDYNLLTEINDNEPLILQLVADYKQECSTLQLERAIDELTTLVSFEYPEEKLRDEIFEELLIELSLSHLGLTHQEFLIEVLNTLKRHDKEGGHTDERHIGKSEGWLRKRLRSEGKRKVSSFDDMPAANLTQARFTKQYKKEIDTWLKSNETKPLARNITMDREIGIVVPKNGKSKRTKKAKVVLAKDKTSLGYHVVTSYPIS